MENTQLTPVSETPLKGKVAIVTGSGSGLGLSYARELARRGASVVINDVREDLADSAVETIKADGGQAAAVVVPVGTHEAAQTLVEAATNHFGRLDIVVTNAGILRDKSVLKMTDDDFDAVINVHLKGTFTVGREAFRYFKENAVPGRIIAIGSPAGQYGNFGQSNYSAAKAGIVGLVRTWALEMTRSRVTVNAVIPVAATEMTATVPYFSAAFQAVENNQQIPEFFRRDVGFGLPSDVGGLITFLASDQAKSITGQAIGVGGDRLQLFAQPFPRATEFTDGGWTYEKLSEKFTTLMQSSFQEPGDIMPPLPEHLKPQE